jgi:acetoin:2,6-dichlorophenolindophenol oxidoreductase subunit beta
MNSLSHAQLIRQSTEDFLKSDPFNVLLCEGIDDNFYSTIEGLSLNYPEQSYEIPCSENSMVGMSLSASSYEVTTIVCLQRVEFALLAIEQLVNNSAKNSFLANKQRNNPCLFRFVIGRGWGQGPSHSQSFETLFAQIPDINVFMPVFPNDSKLIFSNFTNYDHPSISLEHRWTHYSFDTYSSRNNCTLGPYHVTNGKDVTVVAYSYNVLLAKTIADEFKKFNIGIEVINLFRLTCITTELIANSIKETNLLLLLDLDDRSFSVSSEILGALALRNSLSCLKRPPKRLSNHGKYSPSSPRLSADYYLKGTEIAKAACDLLDLDCSTRDQVLHKLSTVEKSVPLDVPNQIFSGPF